jgi:hypothetical protein
MELPVAHAQRLSALLKGVGEGAAVIGGDMKIL